MLPSISPVLLLVISSLTAIVSAQTCSNYGNTTSGSSSCLCPPGFNPSGVTNNNCSMPVCGGSLYDPSSAAPGGNGGFGNVSLGSCSCSSGFTGPACTGTCLIVFPQQKVYRRVYEEFMKLRLHSVCTNAGACSSSLSKYLNSSSSTSQTGLNTSLTCNTNPIVYSESQMTCDVIQQTLQSLFPGKTTLTISRALNGSLTPGGTSTMTSAGLATGEGIAFAQLWYDGVEQFYCRASSCTQTVGSNSGNSSASGSSSSNNGSSTWVCPNLACTCRSNTDFCGGGSGVGLRHPS